MLRFFSKRNILIALGLLAIAIALAVGAIVSYLKSPAFEARARLYIVQEIEARTGTKVTLNNFEWSFWQRRIRIEDLTLRGLEPEYQTPLAHFGRIDIGINVQTLLQRHIDLFELTFTRPNFHIVVTPDGKTNIPSPEAQPEHKPFDFQVSIDNFNIMDGSALLNERRLNLDLSLQNLAALLKYYDQREVLEAHLRYDGVVDREPGVKLSFPYTLSADLDYTRATIIAQRLVVSSGKNEVKLQGKVSQVLSPDINGKLDYITNFQVRFLNYFFEVERFAGDGAAAGSLEFSKGRFFTQGRVTSEALDFEGWHATKISGGYDYRYPERRLTVKNLKNSFMGGTVGGDAIVENLPGQSRVLLDLNYSNIDAAGLTRAYPWDPKYRILSTATGTLKGWLEGKLARFDFDGHVDLNGYPAAQLPGTVSLPLNGSTDYKIAPGEARVTNADLRFNSTSVKADGLIQETMTSLKVDMTSSDLRDLTFLYPDANGSGSFSGSIAGPLAKPILNGVFTLQNHAYRQWKIEYVAGTALLDMAAEDAQLKDVRVKQGESEILINGKTALSGSPVDVRIQSNRVAARDLQPYVNRNIGGVFSGDVRVTALTPNLKLEGDVKADDLSIDNRTIGDTRGHVRLTDPTVEIDQLSVRQGNSTLTGNVSFNRITQAIKFRAIVNSVNLQTFYPLGLPSEIQGLVRQADLRGDGTLKQPNVQGNATLQHLSVNGTVFPEVRADLASSGSKLNAKLAVGSNLSVTAEIDTAAAQYPFTARTTFTQYALDNIAKISGGSLTATGTANLSGYLAVRDRIRGDGRIESADIRIQDTVLHPARPFTFTFTPSELSVSDVTLSGQSTQVTLAGTIGLRDPAPLNMAVKGQVDLKLLEAEVPGLLSSGIINLQVDVRGTAQNPDLSGTGILSNASLRRQGFFTGLTNVNGTMSFNQNQIRLNAIEGSAGGGTVHADGTAVLQGRTIQALAIQIDVKNVRLRGYPEGLRTVIDANLNLRGALDSPVLEGNVQIQNLAYRSSFEEFLALMSQENLGATSSPLGHLRLALHIEGGQNITIQNQLADVQARVNLDAKGTVDEPSVTGHIEASGGTLLFQGNRYIVTRGNIDFVDPLKIEPVIDVEAESQVRDYRVILSITGRGNNPKLAMRSDPPLPELEIVSLIAGGRSREEIAQQSESLARNVTSERLFQSGAASILFDLLQQRVGNRLGLLGTGRVRIDPFLVGAENNPSARITLSEQVTKELSVTYSQDLASNRQQVISIEYFVSRNTSIVASRDEFGNFGLDLRHRTSIK
jgi:translocation and assembly module TamB